LHLLENLGVLQIKLYLLVILDLFRIPQGCRGSWVLRHQVDPAYSKVVETNRPCLLNTTILLVVSQ
jgi:hypothetical protein